MTTKNFQSYIIVGDKKQTGEHVESFLASLNVKTSANPDLTITTPDKSITIGTIREIKNSIYQKPFSQKFRVYIIKEAQKLTAQAQNALLKIFEEPPAHAIIILETSNPKYLLETLRSRAVNINIAPRDSTDNQNQKLNLKDSLLAIDNSIDPSEWIDMQIDNAYRLLKKQIATNQDFTTEAKTIENFKEAKLMIEANVNPVFVLANAILNSHTL